MNERSTDFELLRNFIRQGDQPAFAAVVRRHLDLVYATALRKAEDEGAAQEIAQNVFATLARKAWQFAPDDSLPAWLYKTTLLEAREWLRGELRRRRREQTAAELGTTMKTPEEQSAFRTLVPLLDEALLSLREKDRTALLLRFYERQSLREVGASLGVGEDAAQKRVGSALGKLSQFFQRRGFKTASVAVAAAALQHTAAAASSATMTLVMDAAFKSAPPALAGLSATVAKFAALSKAQTAGLCVALAIIPVAWQWGEARVVGKETRKLRSQLEGLRMQREQALPELERLRAEAARLEKIAASASVADPRELEAARRLADLKARGQALLSDANYRWPDDLPFVRVPKSAVSAIYAGGGPVTPATLESKVNQFLDLTVPEREATAQIFSNYFAGIDHLQETSLYETNQASSLQLPPGAESRVFVLEPMGEKIRTALNQLGADLARILGEDRWAMVKPDDFEFTHYEQNRLLGYTQFAWNQRQEVAVNIFANAGGEPTISWASGDGEGMGAAPLRLFLPENRPSPHLDLSQGPPVLFNRVQQYITAQATARLSTPATR
jgi:RNA polymerase sigma factor (sigma-70 family)